MTSRCARGNFNAFALRAKGFVVRLLRACLKMGRGSVWEGRVRLARREEEADPQRSVTDKQRHQRTLPIFRQALCSLQIDPAVHRFTLQSSDA